MRFLLAYGLLFVLNPVIAQVIQIDKIPICNNGVEIPDMDGDGVGEVMCLRPDKRISEKEKIFKIVIKYSSEKKDGVLFSIRKNIDKKRREDYFEIIPRFDLSEKIGLEVSRGAGLQYVFPEKTASIFYLDSNCGCIREIHEVE